MLVELVLAGPGSPRAGALAHWPAVGKYDALAALLRHSGQDTITLSFAEVATCVGGLPGSAYAHPAWWGNDGDGRHVQATAWLSAGYRVKSADQLAGTVTFTRTGAASPAWRRAESTPTLAR